MEGELFPALHSKHINGGSERPGQSGSHNRLEGDYPCNLRTRSGNAGHDLRGTGRRQSKLRWAGVDGTKWNGMERSGTASE